MLHIRRFEPDRDAAQLPELFRSFTGKAYQQRVQGIDATQLAQFLAERAIAEAKSTLMWIAESRITNQESRLVGLAALQTKHWHSEHTGFPVGKVTQLMTAPGSEAAIHMFLAEIENAACEHGLKHLAGRVDGSAFLAQETLTARGWYPTGTSVKLVCRLSADSRLTSHDSRLTIRPHKPADRERVLAIGTEGHEENHLYFDPHLPNAASHAIFRRWVEKCLDGLAAQVWIAELPSDSRLTSHDSRLIGFTTILDPKSFNAALGSKIAVLDYIVLDRAVQGQGLGSEHLLAVHQAVAQSGFDQIELRTTATNYPAANLYTKHGYKLVGTDQVFGRWLG